MTMTCIIITTPKLYNVCLYTSIYVVLPLLEYMCASMMYTYTPEGEVQNLGGDILEFDSYMVGGEDLGLEGNRLLEVDNRLLLPVGEEVSILVTAVDVLHSFAVSSLGLKINAVPGRLNQLLVKVNWPRVYYEQCLEICGANHSFMPIVVKVVSIKEYNGWMKSLE